MSIKIRAEKEVRSDGVKGWKVKKLDALKRSELPSLYIEGDGPKFWIMTDGLRFDYPASARVEINGINTSADMMVGGFIPDDVFVRKLEYIKRSGNRLTSINRELEKLRAEWNGVENFIF